jgi:geranylgeranyl diphosphate synthase, type I
MPTLLHQLQTRFGDAVDREIDGWISRVGGSSELSDMMRYQLGYVDEQLRPLSARRGKRFRPLLCLLACEAIGGSFRDALPVAAAIELLHNFSLIHDDIEDHDPTRRHRPTVWKLWGEPQAINTGDAMFALASLVVLHASADPGLAHQIAIRFQQVTFQLTEGQYLDMSFEHRQDVTPDDYLHMISLKTGAIIGFSLWSGAFIGGAGEETSERLGSFGLELGKAYQVWDDVSGIWAAASDTGKEPVKDLQNRKKTLPILLALQHASSRDRDSLTRYMTRTDHDLEQAFAVLAQTGSREMALRVANAHLQKALQDLGEANIDVGIRRDLETLAHELVNQ